VLGTVRAVANDNLHLGAELENGDRILGQHLLTGKEAAPIVSPIKHLCLTESLDQYQRANSRLRKKNRRLVQAAELICYPPGSFYTSLMANLLPKGVGQAIADNGGPKVYIPNLGKDSEQLGLSLRDQVERLIGQLQQDAPDASPDSLLNIVLLDTEQGDYQGKLSVEEMKKKGIQIIDTQLISKQSAPYYDNSLLVPALLSLT
jgi:CofD-related protein of GAK system